jgi:hypothetical protein
MMVCATVAATITFVKLKALLAESAHHSLLHVTIEPALATLIVPIPSVLVAQITDRGKLA